MKQNFKDMNIFKKIKFVIGLISLVVFLFMQINSFLNPQIAYGVIKNLIDINPELLELFEINFIQLFGNVFGVSFFILIWLFIFLLIGIFMFVQHNKVKQNITISVVGIISTVFFTVSLPIGIFLTLSPDQYSLLTTIFGSILVIYGIQKYIIKPLFNLLISEIAVNKDKNKVSKIDRKAKHFRPPRKRRR